MIKRSIWIGVVLILFVSVSSLLLLRMYDTRPFEGGFGIVSIEDNVLLLSDADISSYNWTSQEMAISNAASQRLLRMEDSLYNFNGGFIVKIDGEEVYRGIFRTAYMSATPTPPKISILFPSVFWPSSTENPNALMMFYPSGQPPSDQPEANTKLSQYFESTNKLTY